MPALRAFFFIGALLAAQPLQAYLSQAPGEFSLVTTSDRLSAHKPVFIFPLTYSPDFEGTNTEVVYQISAKQRLLNRNLFFAYTQKSFWQLYNKDQSSPFRETNYNPELFYRWRPQGDRWKQWGLDIGGEHESNGQTLPRSRSWDRLYLTPFFVGDGHISSLKLWWRRPEDRKDSALDARGDDNPDIEDFYGYGEFQHQRNLGDQHRLSLMLRGNPATGNGAGSLTWSWGKDSDSFFYCLSLWHGYGESLINYDQSITRIGIGVMLTR